MFDKEDYQALLDRARKKRNQHPYTMYVVFAAAVILVVLLIIGVGALAKRRLSEGAAATEPQQQMQETTGLTLDPEAESRAEEESLRAQEESRQAMELAEKQAVVASYGNIGFVQVSGYLNVRRSPDPSGDIIGKMQENTVCEILGQEGDCT